ncbi:hypothetical protein L9F63_003214, partial [Diploptera punctata]
FTLTEDFNLSGLSSSVAFQYMTVEFVLSVNVKFCNVIHVSKLKNFMNYLQLCLYLMSLLLLAGNAYFLHFSGIFACIFSTLILMSDMYKMQPIFLLMNTICMLILHIIVKILKMHMCIHERHLSLSGLQNRRWVIKKILRIVKIIWKMLVNCNFLRFMTEMLLCSAQMFYLKQILYFLQIEWFCKRLMVLVLVCLETIPCIVTYFSTYTVVSSLMSKQVLKLEETELKLQLRFFLLRVFIQVRYDSVKINYIKIMKTKQKIAE